MAETRQQQHGWHLAKTKRVGNVGHRLALPADHLESLSVQVLAHPGETVGADADMQWRHARRSGAQRDLAQHARATRNGDDLQGAVTEGRNFFAEQVAHVDRRLGARTVREARIVFWKELGFEDDELRVQGYACRALMWWQAALAAMVGFVVAQAPPPPGASAEIRDASGNLLATAAFREGRGEVLVTITFPPQARLSGAHAIHINDTGRCDSPDFATSGSIFNPFNKQHGRNNPEGAEVGDLPNINFSTGLTSYNTNAIGATLGSGAGSLVNPSRSIVLYSGTDDQQTPPDGNPGTPIGCGVVVPAASGAPSPAPVSLRVASPVSQAVPRPIVPSVVPAVAAQPSPSPVAAAPTPVLILPTPVPLAAAPTQSAPSTTGPSLLNIGVIAALGLALIAGGVLLRRSSTEVDQQKG